MNQNKAKWRIISLMASYLFICMYMDSYYYLSTSVFKKKIILFIAVLSIVQMIFFAVKILHANNYITKLIAEEHKKDNHVIGIITMMIVALILLTLMGLYDKGYSMNLLITATYLLALLLALLVFVKRNSFSND